MVAVDTAEVVMWCHRTMPFCKGRRHPAAGGQAHPKHGSAARYSHGMVSIVSEAFKMLLPAAWVFNARSVVNPQEVRTATLYTS